MAVSRSAGTPTPNIGSLLLALKKLTDKWFLFGTHLGVPVFQLKSIESSNSQRDLERCMLDMLQYWLDNTLCPSWTDVVQALEKVDQLVLAAEVKEMHLLTPTVEKGLLNISYVTCLAMFMVNFILTSFHPYHTY